MRLDRKHDAQVARGSTAVARFAFAAELEHGLIVGPGRHMNIKRALDALAPGAAARLARIGDHAAAAATKAAGLGHGEETLLNTHLTGATARLTILWSRASGGAVALAL